MPAHPTSQDRAPLLVFVPLMTICVALFFWGGGLPQMLVSRAAVAFYLPFRTVAAGAERLTGYLLERERLLSESTQLQRARVLVGELREENTRLREQLAFQGRDTLHLLPAWVLAKQGDRPGTRVLINRGELDGVRVGYPVITDQGLVGLVDAVESHLARVRLLVHRQSAVSAVVDRSRVEGVLEGDPLEGLRLRFVPATADVQRGDLVLTSGLGGSFPQGLRIGRVRRLGLEQGGLLRRIEIEPAAPPEALQDVFVLAPTDSSTSWGFLWSRPQAPTDSLARSLGMPEVAR